LFEKKEGYGFHDFDCVDLISKESLFVPHESHEEFFVFENERQRSVQKVDRTLEHFGVLVVGHDWCWLHCCIVHNFCRLNNLVL